MKTRIPASAVLICFVLQSAAADAALSVPAQTAAPRAVYLIEDAHTNASGQFAAAAELRKLISGSGLKTVYLEGSDGDVSLSFLRRHAPEAAREAAAAPFVRKGMLQAAEYLSAASELEFDLIGVEDRALYDDAAAAFAEAAEGRDAALAALSKIRSALKELAADSLEPSLFRFLEARRAFEKGETPFTEYASYLEREASKRGVDMTRFRLLRRLARVRVLESKVDFAQAAAEARAASASLSDAEPAAPARAGHDDLERAAAAARAYRALVARSSEPLPALAAYARYLESASRLDAEKLFSEMGRVESALESRLCSGEAERRFAAALRAQQSLESVVRLAATPREVARLERSEFRDLDSLAAFVNRRISESGAHFGAAVFEDASAGRTLEAARAFYRLTRIRDLAFVERIVSEMAARGETEAAFVAGGFHAPHLRALFARRGIRVVPFRPQIAHPTDAARYEKLLLGRTGGAARADALMPPALIEGARRAIERGKTFSVTDLAAVAAAVGGTDAAEEAEDRAAAGPLRAGAAAPRTAESGSGIPDGARIGLDSRLAAARLRLHALLERAAEAGIRLEPGEFERIEDGFERLEKSISELMGRNFYAAGTPDAHLIYAEVFEDIREVREAWEPLFSRLRPFSPADGVTTQMTESVLNDAERAAYALWTVGEAAAWAAKTAAAAKRFLGHDAAALESAAVDLGAVARGAEKLGAGEIERLALYISVRRQAQALGAFDRIIEKHRSLGGITWQKSAFIDAVSAGIGERRAKIEFAAQSVRQIGSNQIPPSGARIGAIEHLRYARFHLRRAVERIKQEGYPGPLADAYLLEIEKPLIRFSQMFKTAVWSAENVQDLSAEHLRTAHGLQTILTRVREDDWTEEGIFSEQTRAEWKEFERRLMHATNAAFVMGLVGSGVQTWAEMAAENGNSIPLLRQFFIGMSGRTLVEVLKAESEGLAPEDVAAIADIQTAAIGQARRLIDGHVFAGDMTFKKANSIERVRALLDKLERQTSQMRLQASHLPQSLLVGAQLLARSLSYDIEILRPVLEQDYGRDPDAEILLSNMDTFSRHVSMIRQILTTVVEDDDLTSPRFDPLWSMVRSAREGVKAIVDSANRHAGPAFLSKEGLEDVEIFAGFADAKLREMLAIAAASEDPDRHTPDSDVLLFGVLERVKAAQLRLDLARRVIYDSKIEDGADRIFFELSALETQSERLVLRLQERRESPERARASIRMLRDAARGLAGRLPEGTDARAGLEAASNAFEEAVARYAEPSAALRERLHRASEIYLMQYFIEDAFLSLRDAVRAGKPEARLLSEWSKKHFALFADSRLEKDVREEAAEAIADLYLIALKSADAAAAARLLVSALETAERIWEDEDGTDGWTAGARFGAQTWLQDAIDLIELEIGVQEEIDADAADYYRAALEQASDARTRVNQTGAMRDDKSMASAFGIAVQMAASARMRLAKTPYAESDSIARIERAIDALGRFEASLTAVNRLFAASWQALRYEHEFYASGQPTERSRQIERFRHELGLFLTAVLYHRRPISAALALHRLPMLERMLGPADASPNGDGVRENLAEAARLLSPRPHSVLVEATSIAASQRERLFLEWQSLEAEYGRIPLTELLEESHRAFMNAERLLLSAVDDADYASVAGPILEALHAVDTRWALEFDDPAVRDTVLEARHAAELGHERAWLAEDATRLAALAKAPAPVHPENYGQFATTARLKRASEEMDELARLLENGGGTSGFLRKYADDIRRNVLEIQSGSFEPRALQFSTLHYKNSLMSESDRIREAWNRIDDGAKKLRSTRINERVRYIVKLFEEAEGGMAGFSRERLKADLERWKKIRDLEQDWLRKAVAKIADGAPAPLYDYAQRVADALHFGQSPLSAFAQAKELVSREKNLQKPELAGFRSELAGFEREFNALWKQGSRAGRPDGAAESADDLENRFYLPVARETRWSGRARIAVEGRTASEAPVTAQLERDGTALVVTRETRSFGADEPPPVRLTPALPDGRASGHPAAARSREASSDYAERRAARRRDAGSFPAADARPAVAVIDLALFEQLDDEKLFEGYVRLLAWKNLRRGDVAFIGSGPLRERAEKAVLPLLSRREIAPFGRRIAEPGSYPEKAVFVVLHASGENGKSARDLAAAGLAGRERDVLHVYADAVAGGDSGGFDAASAGEAMSAAGAWVRRPEGAALSASDVPDALVRIWNSALGSVRVARADAARVLEGDEDAARVFKFGPMPVTRDQAMNLFRMMLQELDESA